MKKSRMKWTTAKRYVQKHYPDARCVLFPKVYLGNETIWHVICADFVKHKPNPHTEELGASSKKEELAWVHAASKVKEIIKEEMMRLLEK